MGHLHGSVEISANLGMHAQVNRHSADPSMTEAAEKEDAMAQQLDNLEAQVRPFASHSQRAATVGITNTNQCIPWKKTVWWNC